MDAGVGGRWRPWPTLADVADAGAGGRLWRARHRRALALTGTGAGGRWRALAAVMADAGASGRLRRAPALTGAGAGGPRLWRGWL